MPARSPYARYGRSTITGSTQIERRHTVRGGETLPLIAHRELDCGYDDEAWRQIAEANDIQDLDDIDVNTVLVIPSPKPSET